MKNLEPNQPRADTTLSPELSSFAASTIGPLTEVGDLSWSHGESEVWRVVSRQKQAVLKVQRQARKFRSELAAYSEWLPLLAPALEAGTKVPELLAVRSEHPRALLLSWEAGELLEGLTLAPEVETALHERAGRFLRGLHELPVEGPESVPDAVPDDVPLAEAYLMRMDTWGQRASGIVESAVVEGVRSEVTAAMSFLESCTRVPCHRDFTPRNWLVTLPVPLAAGAPEPPLADNVHTPPNALVVIDFEHAKPDLYLTDLQRLWAGMWRQRPDLKRSFMWGYGRDLSAVEERALRRLSALWALSTVVWAREHADAEFEESGWDVLRWLDLV